MPHHHFIDIEELDKSTGDERPDELTDALSIIGLSGLAACGGVGVCNKKGIR